MPQIVVFAILPEMPIFGAWHEWHCVLLPLYLRRGGTVEGGMTRRRNSMGVGQSGARIAMEIGAER